MFRQLNDRVMASPQITLGQVAEYWLTDPQRTFELQSSLGRGYLELWAHTARRMAGGVVPPT